MSRTSKFICTVLFLLSVLPSSSFAIETAPELLGDINQTLISDSASDLTPLGSNLIFRRYSEEFGEELWISDGTEAGTQLLKDIEPGPGSSYPERFVLANLPGGDRLFFVAYTTSNGGELWMTDGTTAGTVLVKDIFPGASSSNINWMVYYSPEQKIVFSADDGLSGSELWISDGTPAGTEILVDGILGEVGLDPQFLVVTSGGVAFSGGSTTLTGRELWITEPDLSNVHIVKDLSFASNSSSPTHLHWNPSMGKLFYRCTYVSNVGNQTGPELCASDLTESGTGVLVDIVPGPVGGLATGFTGFAGKVNKVFFAATDAIHGVEPWITDGTVLGTMLIKDIMPGGVTSSPVELTAFGNSALFSAFEPTSGTELWVTDGTEVGTNLVKNIATSGASSFPSNITAFNGKAYFIASDDMGDREVYSTDGTEVGTNLVSDVNPYGSGECHDLVASATNLYFLGLTPHRALFSIDTLDQLDHISDIAGVGTESSNPNFLGAVGNTVIIYADTLEFGSELWASTSQGEPTLLKDICPGTCSSVEPDSFTVIGDKAVFVADDQATGAELWVTDGTPAGTKLISDLEPGPDGSYPFSIVSIGNSAIFSANTTTEGTAIWKTDGTASGTVVVKDGGDGTQILDHIEFNGEVLFATDHSTYQRELWKTDGTLIGTTLVKDLDPVGGSGPNTFVRAGSTVFFLADLPSTGKELWKTDGTTAGTQLVKDIRPGSESSNIIEMFRVGDKVFFLADDGSGIGEEPWVSDGTAAGTMLLGDFTPGPDSSHLDDSVCSTDSFALFAFDDGDGDSELWISDSTPAGTHLFKDIIPGIEGSYPYSFVSYKNRCFFAATGTDMQIHFWRSDGTSTGTVLLPEPSDGGEPNPNGMLFLDGFAYASVYGSVGDEPYFMSVDECPTDTEKFDAGICGCGISDVDSDSDGTVDCNDVCELDPLKILEGVCGCGIADSDTDSDGVADCNDSCTSDANKTLPGVCGCGTADIDVDGNGTIDCLFTDEFRTRVEALQAGVSALKKAGTTKKKKKKAKELKKAAKELLAILEDYFTLNSLGIQSADGVILEELFGKAVKKVRKSFNIKSPKFRKYKRKAQKKLDELAAGIG